MRRALRQLEEYRTYDDPNKLGLGVFAAVTGKRRRSMSPPEIQTPRNVATTMKTTTSKLNRVLNQLAEHMPRVGPDHQATFLPDVNFDSKERNDKLLWPKL